MDFASARNRVPPLPGIELDGVCYLRDLAETEALRQHLAAAQHVVVIGAGFIGLEFAAVARAHGKPRGRRAVRVGAHPLKLLMMLISAETWTTM